MKLYTQSLTSSSLWLPTTAIAIMFMSTTTLVAQSTKGQAAAPKPDARAMAIRDIVAARDRVYGYVLDMKKKPETDATHVEARKLYRIALGKYNGWAAQVAEGIASKQKNLGSDPAYKQAADEAGAASKAFVDYVEAKTATSKGIFVIATGLADLGLKIWNGVRDRQEKERLAEADRFEKRVRWSQWEEIAAPAAAAK